MNFIQKKIKPYIDENKPDYILFLLASFLIIVSMIFSYSLSIFTVDYYDYGQFHFFIRQLFVGTLAILIMWTMAHIKTDIIFQKYNFGFWIFVVSFVLIILMNFILPPSLVTASGGANRWIRLPGFSLAPVEFFKVGFIYFLSASFHKKFLHLNKVSFKEEVKLLIPYGILFLFIVYLIAVKQKDLGQIVVLGTIIFIFLIFSNRSGKLFLSIIGIAIVGIAILIVSSSHRIRRIMGWWSSVQDDILVFLPDNIAQYLRVDNLPNYDQVSHSLNAIYNGGWFGLGLANGELKLGFLSEVHTDFVLAGITEEIGLFGFFIIILVVFSIIYRIFKISKNVHNYTYHLFSLGIALMITISFLINSYGISGIIPIKGIAVPFLSYGGSAILAISIAMGMVLSISKDAYRDKRLLTKL